MPKRGKVLRDPYVGPGLLMVEGKQYPFSLEGLWRSEVPAKPGLVVNVDFDNQGNLNAITAVPQSQLDQEQAELTGVGAGSRNRMLESWTLGTGTLIQVAAAGVLVASWFFLTAVSIHLPFFGKLDFTLWQILGFLNSGNSLQSLEVPGNPDSGVFGFLGILVLAGPFLQYFWNDPRAVLGGALPLNFMLFVAYRVGASIHAVFGAQLTGPYELLPTNLRYGILNVLSVGLGTYLSATLAIYFAVLSTRQFIAERRHRKEPNRPLKVAA